MQLVMSVGVFRKELSSLLRKQKPGKHKIVSCIEEMILHV